MTALGDAALRAALSHLARGDAEAALWAASEACHESPSEPRAHYLYGQAWLAKRQPARAEQAFAAAVKLAPDWADAWVNYGVARYQQGDVDSAVEAMREALRREPGHAAAAANLGAFLRLTGRAEAGETLLRQAIARDPANAGARLNLVADFLQAERAGEALALLDEAEPPAGEARIARHWLLQRALAQLQLGRADAARATLGKFDALGPCPAEFATLWRWRRVLIAMADGDPAGAGTEAEAMEAALAQAAGTPEHRIMANFDLAKFWSGAGGDRRRAFGFWREGHRLLQASQPFSRAEHKAFIDAEIEAFSLTRLAAGPMASNRDPAPVFIVGMPRSGTTLCEQVLAAHAQVHGAGERIALPHAFAALAGGNDAEAVRRVAALDAAALDAAAARYLADLHALAPDKTRIVDKMPGNYAHLGFISTLLPGAKIIHCERDPRDIGLSIFTFRFHGNHPYAHDLADLGWSIAEQARLMAHWKAALGDRILTIRLSDWVEDFDGTLARALDHLGLPHDPNCARFYEADARVRTVSYAQVRQPVNARGLGRWRAYEAELGPLIAELEAAGLIPPETSSPAGNRS